MNRDGREGKGRVDNKTREKERNAAINNKVLTEGEFVQIVILGGTIPSTKHVHCIAEYHCNVGRSLRGQLSACLDFRTLSTPWGWRMVSKLEYTSVVEVEPRADIQISQKLTQIIREEGIGEYLP